MLKNKLNNIKYITIGLVIGLSLTVIPTFAKTENIEAFFNNIKLKVNGVIIETDVEPIIVSGRTLVPARFIAESLGAEVSWNETDNTVEVTSKVDGKKYTKSRFLNMDAVTLDGNEIFISANDLLANKDKIIGEVVKIIPTVAPTPNPSINSTKNPLYPLSFKVINYNKIIATFNREAITSDDLTVVAKDAKGNIKDFLQTWDETHTILTFTNHDGSNIKDGDYLFTVNSNTQPQGTYSVFVTKQIKPIKF